MPKTALPLALLALTGCAGHASNELAARELLGPYRVAVRAERSPATLPARTCAVEAVRDGLPAQTTVFVASLLERRGWTLAADPLAAEAIFRLSDGVSDLGAPGPFVGSATGSGRVADPATGNLRQGFNGSGDILYRGQSRGGVAGGGGFELDARPSRRLEISAVVNAGGSDWSGISWIDAQRALAEDDLNDLGLALADRLPSPQAASAERAAVDRLGTDFVMILDVEQRLVPVVLAVRPGGVAERAGWRARDRLLSVDGTPTTADSWRGIAGRLAAAESRAIEVELLRDGERYLTFLVPAKPRPVG